MFEVVWSASANRSGFFINLKHDFFSSVSVVEFEQIHIFWKGKWI